MRMRREPGYDLARMKSTFARFPPDPISNYFFPPIQSHAQSPTPSLFCWLRTKVRESTATGAAAMSIRTKFFALAGVILAMFGIVVGVLSILQAATAHKLEDIVEHHQKLRRILADLDVATDEYELRAERLRRQPDRPATELQAAADAIERVGGFIIQDFDKLRTALDDAVAYNRDDPDDLRVLSRVQGALPLIARQVDPFIAVGKTVTDAVLAGR